MIRINLLPEKRAAQRRTAAAEGQAWLVIVAGVLVFEIIGLLLLQKSKNDELARAMKHNQEIQANIDDIKRQISNRDAIKNEIGRASCRERV